MKANEMVIDRREALRRMWIIGGGLAIASGIGTLYYLNKPIPKVSRTIGETDTLVPQKLIEELERISIDGTELSKSDIDFLTRKMQPIDYSRVCNSNPSLAMPTTKYGMSLPEALDYIGKGHIANPGMVEIGATDWYTLVAEDPKKVFLSISKSNIPEKYWYGKDFELAKKAKMTYSGVFIPEEDAQALPEEDAQAWKDLMDVNSISPLLEEVKPGTYFRGPYGEIIKPEHKDISMNIDNLVLTLVRPDELPLRIYYYDFREIAENNFIMHEGMAYPYLTIKDLLEYGQVEKENDALILHANNYSVSVPPWRQDKLGIIFDSNFEKTRGVPTKLVGGEFLNKAAQIEGFYRIEVV